MNKLLTFPGLQPIYLGDFDFLQQSVNDAFLLLLKGLTGQDNPKCILKAATPEKDGAICFNGEILPLKHYGGIVTGSLVYKIESSYSGERTFKDGNNKKCYETRYVVGTNGSTIDDNRASNFPELPDLLSRNVKIRQSEAHFSDMLGNVSLRQYISIVGSLYTSIGKFTINKDCTLTTLSDQEIVDMPVGNYYFPITVQNNGVLKTIPGKMSIAFDSESNHNKAVISINQTSFKIGDQGYFTINAFI